MSLTRGQRDDILLLEALEAAPSLEWWDSESGREFVATFRRRIAVGLAATARRQGHFDVHVDDIVDLFYTALLEPEEQAGRRLGLARNLPNATDFWAYTYTSVRRWCARDIWGEQRPVIPDDPSKLTDRVSVVMRPREILDNAVVVPDGVDWRRFPALNPITPIGRATQLTVSVLTKFCTPRYHLALSPAVSWLAVNPEQHRGHGQTEVSRAGSDIRALGFTAREASRLAQVCWGVRGRARETSVLGGYLVAAGEGTRFNPLASGTHIAVLRAFREATLAQREGAVL